MTSYTESTLRLQVAGQLMGSQPQPGQRVVVRAETREQYRHELGKAVHEPIWLSVDVCQGSRVRTVDVELVT